MNTTLDVAEPMPMPAIHQELAPQISPEAERPHVRRLREALQLALILLFEISVGLEPPTPPYHALRSAIGATVGNGFRGFRGFSRPLGGDRLRLFASTLLHNCSISPVEQS
jgi:hypothetical protein